MTENGSRTLDDRRLEAAIAQRLWRMWTKRGAMFADDVAGLAFCISMRAARRTCLQVRGDRGVRRGRLFPVDERREVFVEVAAIPDVVSHPG